MDWSIFTKDTAADYRKAYEKGDFSSAKGHSMVKGGNMEIRFALDIAKIYFNVEPTGRVLDVATGTGYMAHCWKNMGYEVTGFDILQESVDLARKSYPDIDFFQGDGTFPKRYFDHSAFNIVFIREFHPFSRLDDYDFQIRIIEDYLDILYDGGLLIIDQSRRLDCPNLNMERVRKDMSRKNVKTTPPLYYFPHKHLGIPPRLKIANIVLSLLTKIYSIARRRYPVELFLIHKSR